MSKDLLDQCINKRCPWSGDVVSVNSLTRYRGRVVGFCNPGCRDKFERAVEMFESALEHPEVVGGEDRLNVGSGSANCCGQSQSQSQSQVARPLHYAPW